MYVKIWVVNSCIYSIISSYCCLWEPYRVLLSGISAFVSFHIQTNIEPSKLSLLTDIRGYKHSGPSGPLCQWFFGKNKDTMWRSESFKITSVSAFHNCDRDLALLSTTRLFIMVPKFDLLRCSRSVSLFLKLKTILSRVIFTCKFIYKLIQA